MSKQEHLALICEKVKADPRYLTTKNAELVEWIMGEFKVSFIVAMNLYAEVVSGLPR